MSEHLGTPEVFSLGARNFFFKLIPATKGFASLSSPPGPFRKKLKTATDSLPTDSITNTCSVLYPRNNAPSLEKQTGSLVPLPPLVARTKLPQNKFSSYCYYIFCSSIAFKTFPVDDIHPSLRCVLPSYHVSLRSSFERVKYGKGVPP